MIPYVGSKYSLSDFILPYIPRNIDFYIEPFGGMFSLYFKFNLSEFPDTKFIYNDINPLNSNLFEQLKKDKFIDKVLKTNVDESFYLDYFENIFLSSEEDRALSWLVILCCGDLKNLMNKNYQGSSNFEVFKFKLPKYIEHLKRITVMNSDYKKIFELYDTGKNSIFYCDPPYKNYENYYVNHSFDSDDHYNLSYLLRKCKSNWILSYYNFENLKNWYSEYKIISTNHNLSKEHLVIGRTFNKINKFQ